MVTLIADAGSTKIEWLVLTNGAETFHYVTRGYNPNYAKSIVFIDILYKDLPENFPAVDAVYYYGSGCGLMSNREEVAQLLRVRFEEASTVVVNHDLMAVCHSIFGHEQGIACILGTGANSCVYDGHEITEQAVSLGYLIGDEGSGCYIGRKLTRAYFYGLMPLELKLAFDNTYHLNINEFIDKVYHQPETSKYLASFVKFAGDHHDHPFVRDLVKTCFMDFIEVFVLRYRKCHDLPIGFVGSVAYHFQDLLQECLASEGLTMGKVRQSPMEGLIQMYS